MKKCPYCGLINPPEAQQCDCGYDFASRTVEVPYSPQAARGAWGRRSHGLFVGLACSAVVGLVGLLRVIAGNPVDGAIELGVGAVVAMVCGMRLVRGR
jgi:hypothetical protein